MDALLEHGYEWLDLSRQKLTRAKVKRPAESRLPPRLAAPQSGIAECGLLFRANRRPITNGPQVGNS